MPSPYSGKVFPFSHNWTDPVTEKLSWLTDVMRKRSGTEQRVKLRQQPRRTIDYTTLIGGLDEIDQRRRFDALMWSTQDKDILVPFWPDARRLSAQLNSGSSQLSMVVDGFDFDDGANSYMMLWKDYKTYEVLRVTTVIHDGIDDKLVFETSTVNTWPKGTVYVPARICKQAPSMSADIFASDIQGPKISFEVKTPTAAPVTHYRYLAPTLDTYRSTDVWPDPGLDGQNARTLERTMFRYDFNVGPFSFDSIQAAPFGSIDAHFQPGSKVELQSFLGWLYNRTGRQKAFWMPTWEQDFGSVLKTAAAQFTASSFGYTAAYANTESRRDIAFIKTDGTMLYRRITASSDDGTLETFTVDTNLPGTMPDLNRTSFLRYCRLDQDDVELSYTTTDDVSVALKVRELIKTA